MKNGVAVDRDLTGRDQSLGFAPRSDSGVRQKLLQSDHEKGTVRWEMAGADVGIRDTGPPSASELGYGPEAGLLRRTRLAQTGDAIAFLPLIAALEQGDAFKTLEDIALGGGGSGAAEAAVL